MDDSDLPMDPQGSQPPEDGGPGEKSFGQEDKKPSKSQDGTSAGQAKEIVCHAQECNFHAENREALREHAHEQRHDPEHLAAYFYCWAPMTNNQRCHHNREGNRNDEIKKHLRNQNHSNLKDDPISLNGWLWVTKTLRYRSRLALGRVRRTSSDARPPGFQADPWIESLLVWSQDMNQSFPQDPGGPILSLSASPNLPPSAPAAGPATVAGLSGLNSLSVSTATRGRGSLQNWHPSPGTHQAQAGGGGPSPGFTLSRFRPIEDTASEAVVAGPSSTQNWPTSQESPQPRHISEGRGRYTPGDDMDDDGSPYPVWPLLAGQTSTQSPQPSQVSPQQRPSGREEQPRGPRGGAFYGFHDPGKPSGPGSNHNRQRSQRSPSTPSAGTTYGAGHDGYHLVDPVVLAMSGLSGSGSPLRRQTGREGTPASHGSPQDQYYNAGSPSWEAHKGQYEPRRRPQPDDDE